MTSWGLGNETIFQYHVQYRQTLKGVYDSNNNNVNRLCFIDIDKRNIISLVMKLTSNHAFLQFHPKWNSLSMRNENFASYTWN